MSERTLETRRGLKFRVRELGSGDPHPARDLGPRLFTFLAGWGSEVFRAGGGWWWVPIVAPCLGGLLGGLVYDLLVARHHPPEKA